MNKKLKKVIAALSCACLTASMLVACGPVDKGGGGTIDEEGNLRPGSKEALVDFWISGDEFEIEVFGKLRDEFNKENKGIIKVEMTSFQQDYDNSLRLSLANDTAPDVFYVGDSGYKSYAELGYLYDITEWVNRSQIYKVEDMWDNVVTRYKYDVNTFRSGTESGKYYGVPKDIGPTVIYYNETVFEKAGITIISVDKDGLEAFNNGGADDRGHTKASLGITSKVKEKGFFELDGKKIFNNQIPMSWEETKECALVAQGQLRKDHKGTNSNSYYGYFTEWWFNYGWSVGGNCIQQIPSDQYKCGYYYDFTLMDNTKNYIVADDVAEGVTVNGNHYNAGEIIEYRDKLDMSVYNGKKAADGANMYNKPENFRITSEVLTLAEQGKLNELPSQREAFTEFVRAGDIKDDKGSLAYVDTGKQCYGISPLPTSIDGDTGKVNEFEFGKIAMLVDGRWDVTKFREDGVGFTWDVAPLPMYKTYYEAGDSIPEGKEIGDIKVHGIEAGHSGSVGLCISKKSPVAPEAWKFIEFCAGEHGQTLQAEKGFAIPLQKKLANSPVFLQTDKMPKNSKVFIRATEYEQAGDWWFLQDNAWINDWANVLNGSVRNAKKTLSQFYTDDTYKNTFKLLEKYTADDRVKTVK